MRAEKMILSILQQMVSKPDEVQLARSNDNRGVVLTLTSNASDAGIIIGKGGETLNAIRKLALIVGRWDKESVRIVYNDPAGNFRK